MTLQKFGGQALKALTIEGDEVKWLSTQTAQTLAGAVLPLLSSPEGFSSPSFENCSDAGFSLLLLMWGVTHCLEIKRQVC